MFHTLAIVLALCHSVLGEGYRKISGPFIDEMYDKCWTEVYLPADTAGYITYSRTGPYPPYTECAVSYYTDSGYVISLGAFNLTGMPSDCSDYIFACKGKEFLCDTDTSSVHYCWKGVYYSNDVTWGRSITIRLFSDHSTQGTYNIEYRVEEAETDGNTVVYIVVGVIAAVCVVVAIIFRCCRNEDDDLPPLNIPPVNARGRHVPVHRNDSPFISERDSRELRSTDCASPGLIYHPPAVYPSAPSPHNPQRYGAQQPIREPVRPIELRQELPPPPYEEALQMPRKQPTTS